MKAAVVLKRVLGMIVIGILLTGPCMAANVSKGQAMAAVKGWLKQNDTRLGLKLGKKVKSVEAFKGSTADTVYFVVSLDPEGYVVLAPDDEMEPLIAFSNDGTFQRNPENPLSNLLDNDLPTRKEVLKHIKKQLAAAKGNSNDPNLARLRNSVNSKKRKWEVLQDVAPTADDIPANYSASISDVHIAPLTESRWSQSTAQGQYCYNYYTPNHYVCGCVATAMAQLMRYHEHPVAGIGQITQTVYVNGSATSRTTLGGDGLGGAYNWNMMPLVPGSTAYNASQWQMIGRLCHDAGVAVHMQYSSGGSGAYMYYCDDVFKSIFGYANAKHFYPNGNYFTAINSNLKAGMPVLLGVVNCCSGHAIICDGLGYDGGSTYHHMNMGWAGSYDAWYNLPSILYWYSIQDVVYNVFPTNTGEIISGRVTNQDGNPMAGMTVTAQISGGGASYTDTTDAKGYYGILGVPSATTFDVSVAGGAGIGATLNSIATGTSGSSSCGNYDNANLTIVGITFSATGLDDYAFLRWNDPSTCGYANSMVYIRRSTVDYPVNPTDGEEVYAGTAKTFKDTGLTKGQTYYYTIWCNDGSPYADVVLGTKNATATPFGGTARVYWQSSDGYARCWHLNQSGKRAVENDIYSGSLGAGYWHIVASGDIDRDGIADLVWQGMNGETYYWLLAPDGILKASGNIYSGTLGYNYWHIVGMGDIDRDGTADLVWQGMNGETYYWLLNPTGTLRSSGYIYSGTLGYNYWHIVGMGDIDRDGTADLVWQGNNGETYYWLLNPTGTLRTANYIYSGTLGYNYWHIKAVGDIDRDGTIDLIWQGMNGETYYWLLNPTGTLRSSGYIYSGTLGYDYWHIMGAPDIDGDGTVDIVWQGNGGETYYWLLNQNGTYKSSGNISSVSMPYSQWQMKCAGN